MNIYKGYDLDNLSRQCIKEVGRLSRIAGTEGAVLLKNDGVLPFDKTKSLAVFGRTQIDYVKSGTGSGGLVNIEYHVNIIDGLKNRISVNQDVLNVYKEWLRENPFDAGHGWATEPWAQEEMLLSDELCLKAAEKSDYALVVIGRASGEDRDNFNAKKSYLLSDEEEQVIATVCKHFKKVCVVLNTGNIIDMKWVEKYNVPCVMYSWQGGSEGGNSLADILLGDVSPSGRLSDTIAYNIEDYPSNKNHGAADKNIYEEDIYMGYRYFETFAKDRVMYPFGFGLSYTRFECAYDVKAENGNIVITANVKNIGKYKSKTVIQFYYGAPQGKLGNPARQLVRYEKTKLLDIGETQSLTIEFPFSDMASYDDKDRFAYILQGGEYVIYAGENVRDAKEIFKITLEEKITKQLRQSMAPVEEFHRIVPKINGNEFEVSYEKAPLCQYDISKRKLEHVTKQEAPVNKGITMKDVAAGKNSLEEFVGQLSVKELSCLVKGEGMNSPKVTAGTGGAFGGVTEALLGYGMPIICVTDGPSGIRMDSGDKASLIPNGTCLASSWNRELVQELYAYVGVELRANNIDILLAPGMNIHRHPLNGRNFEYFSEDPYLSGTIGGSCTRGLDEVGVAGTIKHFACNSQEFKRGAVDSVVSERALREIYLKPYEIAVKWGKASAIMTSYNKVNGIHSAGNYDLCSSILRDEWGYKGIVMTDWWARVVSIDKTILAPMVMAQNDLYMVTASSEAYGDNIIKSVEEGSLDITFLRKCATNIVRFMLTSPAMNRERIPLKSIDRSAYLEVGNAVRMENGEEYDGFGEAQALEIKYKTSGSELAQYIINVFDGEKYLTCILVQASGETENTAIIKLPKHGDKLTLKFTDAFEYITALRLKKQ